MAIMTAPGPRTPAFDLSCHTVFLFPSLVKIFSILFFRKTRGSVSIGGVLEVTFRPSVRKVRFPLHSDWRLAGGILLCIFRWSAMIDISRIQGASH